MLIYSCSCNPSIYYISLYHWHFLLPLQQWYRKNLRTWRRLHGPDGPQGSWCGLSHWVTESVDAPLEEDKNIRTMDMMDMACHGMPELHLIHTKDLEGGMNQRCAYRILQVQRGVSTFCQSLDTLCTGTQRKCQIVQHHIRNMSSSRARQKSAVLTVCFFSCMLIQQNVSFLIESDWIYMWKVFQKQSTRWIYPGFCGKIAAEIPDVGSPCLQDSDIL